MEANQRNERIFKFFYKTFLIGCPICMLIECIGILAYCKLKFGHVDNEFLFSPTKWMYEK